MEGEIMDPADIPLCNEYAATGTCSAGEDCLYVHGDVCEVGVYGGYYVDMRYVGGVGWWGAGQKKREVEGGVGKRWLDSHGN
jgi:hypothetical protein